MLANDDRTALYVVRGALLELVRRDGTRQELGRLRTRTGFVDMKIGVQQMVIVDGPNGYVLTLSTNQFQRITSPAWRGSPRVGYVDGYFIFTDPRTGVFYISAIEDAATLDTLDFATASSSPDDLIAGIDDHGEMWLFGSKTVEVWRDVGNADFPFAKQPGATMQTGLMGAFTVCSLDNTLYWLGTDKNGGGVVWRAQGYQPQRVSTKAVDEALQAAIRGGADMTKAIAHAYQQDGHSFYALSVPGVSTTWVYDVGVGQWHERGEFALGDFLPHRAQHHAYCYGKNLVGGADGRVFELDPKAFNNAGDPLVRERTSPHYADPSMQKIKFGPFQLDCTVGKGRPDGLPPQLMLSTSDDGGETWGTWRTTSLGEVGRTKQKAQFLQNGAACDRVWRVRVADDVEFSITSAAVSAMR